MFHFIAPLHEIPAALISLHHPAVGLTGCASSSSGSSFVRVAADGGATTTGGGGSLDASMEASSASTWRNCSGESCAGSCVGEGEMLSGARYTASLRALSPCVLLR